MKNINAEKQLGMAWYKFLIYFALFAGAVLNFIYGVNYLTGGIYYSQTNGQITPEIVYAYYGEALKFVDIVMGLSLIAFSSFGLILRQKLVKYSPDAPKLVYVFYSLSFGIGCIYSFLVSAIIAKPIGVSEVCSLVTNGFFLFFNIQYFRRRAHLFVGINPSVSYSEPVLRLKNEEHLEKNSFSDNTVKINLSPVNEKQKRDVSGYHIYDSDVKLDKDVQPQNSCPIAEQSNYTYDSTYNPFAEKNVLSAVKQKYCSRCGNVIDNNTKKCMGCGKQYFKLQLKPMYVVFAVLFLLVGYVSVNYCCAVSSMNDQKFIRSKQYFDNLLVSDAIFSKKYAYVEAGVLLEEGKYVESFEAFSEVNGIPVPSTITDSLKAKIYSAGQIAYKSGNMIEAQKQFSTINGYKRSADYLFLIKCNEDNFTGRLYTVNNYNELIKLLGFEDTENIILNNDVTLVMFLEGRWEDGANYDPYYFELIEESDGEWCSEYNLPYKDVDGYFYLSNAIFSIGEIESSAVKCYKFSIIDEDTIWVYCYKDGSTHKLYRQ